MPAQRVKGVNDGSISTSWRARTPGVDGWVKLTFAAPITINQVVLYDMPSLTTQITSSTISFPDGSMINLNPLTNNGSATYVNLPSPKTVSWIQFQVNALSSTTQYAQLAEMQGFLVDPSTFKTAVARYA
jgi:hypothetical protein